jgi:hypothetical protein
MEGNVAITGSFQGQDFGMASSLLDEMDPGITLCDGADLPPIQTKALGMIDLNDQPHFVGPFFRECLLECLDETEGVFAMGP